MLRVLVVGCVVCSIFGCTAAIEVKRVEDTSTQEVLKTHEGALKILMKQVSELKAEKKGK